jgi:hypothetical protein
MLPSAAFDGSKGRTSVLGLQLTRCEGQRDLVFAPRVKHLNGTTAGAARAEPAF